MIVTEAITIDMMKVWHDEGATLYKDVIDFTIDDDGDLSIRYASEAQMCGAMFVKGQWKRYEVVFALDADADQSDNVDPRD